MPTQTAQFTIGVEEEYQIIDPQTRALHPRSASILPDVPQEAEKEVQSELFLSQIEIGTPVCKTLSAVRAAIIRLRRAVISAAEAAGDRIAAAGTHPFSHWDEQPVTPKQRYLDMEQDYQQIARENVIWGCHVHVGIGDREAAIQTMNRARGWLSPLIALTANSPFWLGEDTGYASFRTEVWRRWPMAGSPHAFASRAEYDALVRTLVETGSISDETKIYWDIRPADRFDTLEFRATDVCMTVDEAVMVAGLARALARACLEAAQHDRETFVPVRPELLRAAEWRAARYGMEGELIHAHAARAVPAPELIETLLDFVRPALEELGEWDELKTLVQETIERGTGAARQRAAYERTGRLEDVVDLIIAETTKGVM